MKRFSKLVELGKTVRNQIEDLNPRVRFHDLMYPLNATLAGACGLASVHLVNMAQKNGLNPTFIQGNFMRDNYYPDGHCWVEYYGCVVDLTATQFSPYYNKIHVVPLRTARAIYKPEFRSTSVDEIMARIKSWTIYDEALKSLA